jgi:membrane-bound lytic murein transglycosylase B
MIRATALLLAITAAFAATSAWADTQSAPAPTAATGAPTPLAPGAPAPITLAPASPVTPGVPVLSPDQKFFAFLQTFRATALAGGISPATYDAAMGHLTRNPRVEQLENQQPEFVTPIWTYLDGMVSDDRVARGQQMMLEEAGVLGNIESRFGVPREVLVAIWGDESNYGQSMGTYNLFEALATLAYDGPRADYAKRELIAALKMVEKDHFDPATMTSSWAGAFGQTQFVPSSFLAHATDGDGDGVINLWTSPADALASTAQLLADAGWQRGADWGYEVMLPNGFDYANADLDTLKSVADWKALGVKTAHGDSLRPNAELGAIYLPAGARGPAFLVFGDFKVVLKYNNAAPYALAVCTLSDRLRGEAPIAASWPRDEIPLAPDERLAFQSTLKNLGYDPGTVDGILGHGTRAALRAWQKANGYAADGFPTKDVLAKLMEQAALKH